MKSTGSVQLTVSSGWDAELVPQLSYGGAGDARAFVSHDELVLMAHRDEAMLDEWRKELQPWSGG